MTKQVPTREQEDRAREWVNENHPRAGDAEWVGFYHEALADIMAIDERADKEDSRLR